jgi:CxxC motif-containing protein
MSKGKIKICKIDSTVKINNSPKKISIIKKEKKFSIPKESTYKILNIDNFKIRHVVQKTPANCGPLSIVN